MLHYDDPQHISSSDPLAKPTINPRYLQSPLDGFLLARAGQFLRQTAAKGPLAQYIDSEAEPGTGVQSDADWMDWVKSVVRTECVEESSFPSRPAPFARRYD